MVRWSAMLVVLLGLWVVGIPFFGPVLGLSMGSMSQTTATGMQGMAAAAPAVVVITASTLWYHLLPGALTVVVGLYQLLAPLRARARSVTQTASSPVSTTS